MKFAILGDFIQSKEFSIDNRLLSTLQDTDFNIANLEAPFYKNGVLPANGKFGLHQLTSDCELLKKLNIKFVCLANNHIMDFGKSGFDQTIEVLHKERIGYFGAGQNLKMAISPLEISINELKIGFWGFQFSVHKHYFAGTNRYGTAPFNLEIIIQSLQSSNANIKIVYNHWNQEFEDYPEPYCKFIGEEIIQYCDLIVGSHPHCIQGIQKIGNKNIFHSLGNFSIPHSQYQGITLSQYRDKCYNAFFPIFSFENNELKYEIKSFMIEKTGTKLIDVSNSKKAEITTLITKISKPLNYDYKIYRKFYNKNKIRKLRFTITKNSNFNIFLVKIHKIIFYVINKSEKTIAELLDKFGLRMFFRTRFSKLIDRFFALK